MERGCDRRLKIEVSLSLIRREERCDFAGPGSRRSDNHKQSALTWPRFPVDQNLVVIPDFRVRPRSVLSGTRRDLSTDPQIAIHGQHVRNITEKAEAMLKSVPDVIVSLLNPIRRAGAETHYVS